MADFQFPTIGSTGLVKDEGIGGTFASSIAGVIKAMQDRVKLDQERQEFESKQQYFKTLDEGNALDNQKKRDAIAADKRTLQSKEGGLAAYSQWVGSGAKQEDLGKILAPIKDPDVSQDLVNRVTSHYDEMNKAAQARHAQAEAEVAAATKNDAIEASRADVAKKQSDANVATATEPEQIKDASAVRKLHQAQATKAIADANPSPAGPDVGLANAAANLGRTYGLPLGQAYQAVGGALPPGVDPAATAQVGSGTGAADKRRNQVTSEAAKASDVLINDMTNRGIRIKKLTPLIANTKLGEALLGKDEQQLLQANRQFAQMYGLFVTGQASSEPELQRILKTVVPSAGDKDPVLQQKALMRQVILQAMQSAYGQGKPASEALTSAAQQAMDMGVPMDGVSFLQKSAMNANNQEVKQARDASQAPILAPATQWTQQDYDTLMSNRNFDR